jgi:hypothetical protein
MSQPVCLRLCTSEMNDKPVLVTERWWRNFLLSQAVAMHLPVHVKESLDNGTRTGAILSTDERGSGTHGDIQQETRERRLQV